MSIETEQVRQPNSLYHLSLFVLILSFIFLIILVPVLLTSEPTNDFQQKCLDLGGTLLLDEKKQILWLSN